MQLVLHIMWEVNQDFWRVMGKWGSWGLYLDPKDAEKPHSKIFRGALSEIKAPWTPSQSQGTKNFSSKILFCHPDLVLFYTFCMVVLQNVPKNAKNCHILPVFYYQGKTDKMTSFQHFLEIFAKQPYKMYKITSDQDD